jgi:hypothetical protein
MQAASTLEACPTKENEENTVATTAVKNVTASNSIAATNNTNENVMSPEMVRAIDSTFVMRFIGRPLAKVETKVVPVVNKVADKTLTTAGKIVVCLGVACLKAGERARNGELAKTRLESAKARHEVSLEAVRKAD